MKRLMSMLLIGLFLALPQVFCVGSDHQTSPWTGEWGFSNTDETGSHASMKIGMINDKQFYFSISASYVNTYTDEDGEEQLNPHEGDIEGIAQIVSSAKAFYRLDDPSAKEDYPDYQMIFLMRGNRIEIQEINEKTGEEYGFSPYAGLNVRYSGIYGRQR